MYKLPEDIVSLIRAAEQIIAPPDDISQVLGITVDCVLPHLAEKTPSPIPPDIQQVIAQLAAMDFSIDQISGTLGLDRLWVVRYVNRSGTQVPPGALSERARKILGRALVELSQ